MAQDLASVLNDTVRTHAQQVESWDRAVRDDADDAVHQMRVSARTLRSVVQVFGPCLATDQAREINRTLRRLGRRLSPARDAEVLCELVAARLDELPVDLTAALPGKTARRLTRLADKEYATAQAELADALDTSEHRGDLAYVSRLDSVDLADDLTDDQREDAAAALSPFVLRRVDEIVTMAKGATATSSPRERNVQLHELRREAKRLRLAAEGVREETGLDLGQDVAVAVRRAHKLQRALGDHRDSVILQELLLRAADRARDKGRDTFGHGVLFAHEARVQEAALARAERHLARLG
ncbi:CHAD domain-containing protein [Janibacter anophelis]|uniref:CHAD domain-containing protein n=1 Tax=Janibacter anophelis TaxID=319054 RepID=UPI00082EF58A|nr:CHAD domain-containing protein [Janibacter anophelis]